MLHGDGQRSHDESQQLKVRLLKDSHKGLGINIIDLKESSGVSSGISSQIVIESVVRGGPADIDGNLKRGTYVCCFYTCSFKMCCFQETLL